MGDSISKDEALAEIQAAARIVRHDFSAARIREVMSEFMDPKPPPEDDGKTPPPPPKKEGEETPPPDDESAKPKGVWWR